MTLGSIPSTRPRRAYRICSRCVMDTTDPDIVFDENNHCNHCTAALARMNEQLLPPTERDAALMDLVSTIKTEGRHKEYDCIIGVSGGCDSTTTAYMVKQLGLRPLAVHFDNGWDSELAVDNITRTLTSLQVDLFTYVVDWEEFRDLQLSFIRSSVANAEAPTDHGITALLFRTARKHRVRFILSGSNLVTEAIMPHAWSHFNQDLRLLKALHRRFGTVTLRTMPTIGIPSYMYSVFIHGIRQIPFLNYIQYDKSAWKKTLTAAIGWRDYGGKHYESIWTRFFQGYYLPKKFGYDKRRAHYSTMICSGLMTRGEALSEMENPTYDDPRLLEEDKAYVLKKFGLSEHEFNDILATPGRPVSDYPSHEFLFRRLEKHKNKFRRIATTP